MTRQLGSFYAVTPAHGEGEFFPRTLDGLVNKRTGAMARARFLSVGVGPQQVILTAGGTSKVIFEYREGRETFRSCAGLIPAAGPQPPAGPAVAEVVDLASRRQRPRRPRRRERVSWPGLGDLNGPPCNTAAN